MGDDRETTAGVAGARGRTLTFRILNASGSAYPFGWPGYNVRASTDREAWRMTPTKYADGVLEWTFPVETELAWFAYFAPYTMHLHDALVARIAARPGVTRACFNLRPGSYAIAQYHDANGDRDFNRTLIAPTEGFGFSNDAPTSIGLPSLKATRFALPAAGRTVRMRMRYRR